MSEFFEFQPEVPLEVILPRDQLFEMQGELMQEINTIRDPETLPFLERFAVNGKAFGLRMNALQALRAISSPQSASTFLKALDDANPDNGFFAMQGLLSLAGPGGTDWVPTWRQFDEAPTLYAAKCREWWRTEGQQRMLAKNSARPF